MLNAEEGRKKALCIAVGLVPGVVVVKTFLPHRQRGFTGVLGGPGRKSGWGVVT